MDWVASPIAVALRFVNAGSLETYKSMSGSTRTAGETELLAADVKSAVARLDAAKVQKATFV
jgi:hypothetical protein